MGNISVKNDVKLTLTWIVIVLALTFVIVLVNPAIIYGLEEGNSTYPSQNTVSLTSTNSKPVLLDPNPSLIDKNGNLITDITQATNTNDVRLGTVSDGISKLLIRIPYDSKLQFSIRDHPTDDLTDGKLSPLTTSSSPSSVVSVDPQKTTNGKLMVIAFYTPPTFLNQNKVDHKVIHVIISDPNNSSFGKVDLPIQIHRLPVVLVHGLWETPDNTWIDTNFTNALGANGLNPYIADYTAHNAKTFDPYDIPRIGNYGIDSIRSKIHDVIDDYHTRSIAISQVDIVGHSMGGLMARGFVQQDDYKSPQNYMEGYVHRLITIGTPHFGAQLAKILFDHRDDCYYYNSQIITSEGACLIIPTFEPLPLKTIYQVAGLPIDQGGVQALSPGSEAYSHLCQTSVPSYAIAGSWRPNAINDHSYEQTLFGNILSIPSFDLDKDGFHGNNDLQVNITSQTGGLHSIFRSPGTHDIPIESEIYPSIVHSDAVNKLDQNVFSELDSPLIQQDVTKLLASPDNKFADAIGIGSVCHIPANR